MTLAFPISNLFGHVSPILEFTPLGKGINFLSLSVNMKFVQSQV